MAPNKENISNKKIRKQYKQNIIIVTVRINVLKSRIYIKFCVLIYCTEFGVYLLKLLNFPSSRIGIYVCFARKLFTRHFIKCAFELMENGSILHHK